MRLPEVDGESDAEEAVREPVREFQEEMCRRYRSVANRGRKDCKVKRKTVIPGTSRKLNVRWGGPR